MNKMSVSNFDELRHHAGHRVACVTYGNENAAIECMDCNEILVSFEKDDICDLLNSYDIAINIADHISDDIMSNEEIAARTNFVIRSLTKIDTFYDLINEIMSYYKKE